MTVSEDADLWQCMMATVLGCYTRYVSCTRYVCCVFGCEQKLTLNAGITPVGQQVHVGLC